jgi:hypothetical protein
MFPRNGYFFAAFRTWSSQESVPAFRSSIRAAATIMCLGVRIAKRKRRSGTDVNVVALINHPEEIGYLNMGLGPEDAAVRNPLKEYEKEFGDASDFEYAALRSMMIAYVPD